MSSPSLTCLCGSIKLPLDTTLPAKTELCHCNPCRHTTGSLFAGFANLNAPPPREVLDKCTVYHSSKTHSRYFCGTCGVKTFIHPHSLVQDDSSVKPRDNADKTWCVVGGSIDPPQASKQDVLYVEMQEWLSDAPDGGIAPYMRRLGDRDIPSLDLEGIKISNADLDAMVTNSGADLPEPGPDDTLTAECRCGGVSLLIQRANHEERSISQLDRFIPKDRNSQPENSKHIAMACACRSCRLHTGHTLATWIYVPPMQIINPHTGKPLVQHRAALPPPERNIVNTAAESANRGLTLKHYWSSPGSCRSFCSRCGCAVFYTVDTRQEIVNVAAGLLRAEEGVMARRWLSWQWGRVSWKDESVDREIMDAWITTEKTGGKV